MALATYSDLLTSVSDWLMRDDLSNVIPSFVALAEADIAKRLRLTSMVERTQITAVEGVAPLPLDCLQIRTVYATTGQLDLLPPTIGEEYRLGLTSGDPQYYTREGSGLRILPAPAPVELTVTYYARPAALSDSNQTNVILTEHPDAMLYGTLLASAPYLSDDQRGIVWKTLFDEAIAKAQAADQQNEFGGHLVIRAD